MLSSLVSRVFGRGATLDDLAHWVLWNLFLAVIPVVLAYLFYGITRNLTGKTRLIKLPAAAILFLLWLAFVPNTCYLVTEWKHFLDFVVSSELYGGGGSAQRQFKVCTQAVFYLLYSGAGMLCFVLAIRPMEKALRERGIPFFIFAIPLFVLMSVGVYLGRSPKYRFNSWDLIDRPVAVWKAMINIPHNQIVLLAVIVFSIILWGLYEALDLWMDGIVERRKRWLKR